MARSKLISLTIKTLIMLLCRLLLFRLHETPKFLVVHGRANDAVAALQDVCRTNGLDKTVHLHDVVDAVEAGASKSTAFAAEGSEDEEDEEDERGEFIPTRVPHVRSTSYKSLPRKAIQKVPVTFSQDPMAFLKDKTSSVQPLFTDKWRLTTFLVWGIWICSSIAYTTFNTFLPYLLEQRNASLGAEGQNESLWEYFIYAASGLPGSAVSHGAAPSDTEAKRLTPLQIAAWMIETRLGRRYSMAISTAGNALFLLLFTMVNSRMGVMLSSGLVSLLSTIMYAVIYGYTPEVFEAEVRGTAAGIAAGLARLIITPITTGFLVGISLSLPLYTAITVYLVCACCMWALPIETRDA